MNTYQASFLTFLGEKPNEQVSWVGINLNIDEVMPWEVRNLCYLMNAILLQAVDKEVNKLRKELCCGCKVDHPSQRRHDCIMMSEEEGWIKHGKKAIKRVFENKILRKLFRDGVRVMKLDYHEQVTEHFDNLSNHFETTLDLLKDLKFNSVGFPEYQDVLGYLRYWSEEH